MTGKNYGLLSAAAALTLAVLAAGAWSDDRASRDDSADEAPTKIVPLKDGRLKIELNSTDQDVGVQLFVDADPWKVMDLFDPNGRLIFRATGQGRFAKQGGTELFIESGEPNFADVPLAEFQQRFPQGNYRIVGRGLDGEKFVGTAKFTHNMPRGPQLTYPTEGALVDPNNTVVMWQGVPAVNGSPIVGYQVLVVKPNSGIAAIPKIILDIMMPPTATSMAVPAGFLLPRSEYEWEVLAIEKGGNQTLSVGHFHTP